MDEAGRALIGLSAALSAGREALVQAVDVAQSVAPAQAVEEALLQSYLFLGYPAALRGLALWRERTGRAAPERSGEEEGERREGGERLCAEVYGAQYARLRANVARLHPDLEAWMLEEGYGKVLSRPGLDVRTRELCVIAVLVGQDASPQLRSHLLGALNVGAAAADVDETVEIACGLAVPERARVARGLWAEVRERRGV